MKLNKILSTFTKTQAQLQEFCEKNNTELEKKQVEVKELETDQVKALSVLKKVNELLGE